VHEKEERTGAAKARVPNKEKKKAYGDIRIISERY
jgi:hypothetical protein